MTELTRLVRPAQSQVRVASTSKEYHAEGIKFPNFRQLNKKARIQLSPQYLSTDQAYVYRNMVVSNKKGWFAAVQNSAGNFGAVLSPLHELRQSMKEASSSTSSFTSQRTLSFSTSEPNILALVCNDSRLLVGFKSGEIIIYDTSSVFTSGSNEISPLHMFQSSQQSIIDIVANPNSEDSNLSDIFAVLRADGTVQLFKGDLEPQGGWVAGDADSTPVAVAWSPKGKQLAIGLRLGDILTFTLEGKASPQRHIPPTAEGVLVSLNWLAPGHTFRTTYAASDPVHHVVFADKRGSPIVWTRLEHSFQVPDRSRQNSYSAVLPKWDDDADDRLMIVVGDVSCTDFEIIGNIGNEWCQQSQENPLSIPLDKESEDTVLLSLQVDLTDTDSTEGGHPIIYAYLNDGTLQGWYVDHPERKPYAGMMGTASVVSTSPFSQPQQPVAFGAQPASSSPFGQSSAFGTSSSFNQATPAAAAAPAFGQSSFTQAGFGQQPAPAFGSSGGGFASFASSPPTNSGGFGSSLSSASTVESPPQLTRDDSMGDSTPSFGGLSLGDSDANVQPKSTSSGTGGMFRSPSPLPLPPDHPVNQLAQQSAFGSESTSFIKPATGFGAFGGSGGAFGAFGNTNKVNSAFSGGAFSTKPDQSSALATNSEQPKSRPAFGQSNFGQSSFGQSSFSKPGFGQPAFGQSSFGAKSSVSSPSTGGFGAFAQSGPTSFGNAAAASSATPAVKTEGGFSGFAGTPSAFGAQGDNNVKKEEGSSSGGFSAFASQGPSPFGSENNKPVSAFGNAPAGGAFSNFASTGPSVFGQPATAPPPKSESPTRGGFATPSSGGAFGGLKSESPNVFGQSASSNSGGAFGGLKSESPSVFGQPAPSGSGGAFGGQSDNNINIRSSTISPGQSPQPSVSSPAIETQEATTPIKSELISPSISSPPSTSITPNPAAQQPSTASSGGAFGNLKTSTSVFKPASGFGAFGNTMPSSSPFLKTNTNNEKPAVSAFGNLSDVKPAFPARTLSSSTGPTFGSTSQLGSGFGLKKADESPPSAAAAPSESSSAMAGAFSAFSGTNTPFSSAAGATKSFGELLQEGQNKPLDKPAAGLPQAQPSPETPSASDQTSSAVKEEGDNDKPLSAEGYPSEDKGKGKAVEEHTSQGSISSTSSSFVEVNEPDEHEESAEEDEVPDSDGDFEQHGDDDADFLSESYGSQSEEEQQLEDVESAEEDVEETSSSPEPTEIPLPRSRSNTPKPEAPKADPTSPSSEDESDSSRLSTIREESTTPPGSPVKQQTGAPSAIVAPAPINPPVSTLGIGRPSTRPTRSSPLASKPLTGVDEAEEGEEDEPDVNPPETLKLHPASPRTPFGVVPPKSRSTSPEESKLADGKRPKTPPLLSNFFGSPSTPSTPKPAVATQTMFATPSKPPSAPTVPLSTPLSLFPASSSSSSNLFGKAFSLQPTATGTDSASKAGSVLAPPSSSFSGNQPTKSDTQLGRQVSTMPSFTLPKPGTPPILSPGAPKMALPSVSPFAPAAVTASPTGSVQPPVVPMENGMQKECHVLVEAMQHELNNLRLSALQVAKKRETAFKSAGGSRRKEDLSNVEKWGISDSVQFGVVLRQFEEDILELKAGTEKQKEEIRDLGKSMIKAGTRREEIARFNKAKHDNEFSKMLKSRTLGPEHLENQTQLRRNIRALRTKVDQLEDQLRAHKKRLSEVTSGRPTLKPPSLDTIHRTYRNIDIAVQQQTDELEQLNARFLRLNLATSTRSSQTERDPRLPAFSSRSRPSIITPDVAVTTAAALNAERSAHKLKTMLLKARQEPLLNVKAKEVVDGGTNIPTAYSTPKPATGLPGPASGVGLQFNTPIIRGPLFDGGSSEAENWDTMSFPEDNFHPSTPLSSGGRRGTPLQRKHGSAPAVKKIPLPSEVSAPPATSFDWGPLPTFNKSSPVLPGFDKLKSPSSSPSALSGSIGLGLGKDTSLPTQGLFGNVKGK